MLDFRHETFLVLAKIKNYTKTAQTLHMTQPAVTQHIQYLEKNYQCKLFLYSGKELCLSEQGMILEQFLLSLRVDSEQIKLTMNQCSEQALPLIFGATLTIGEFIMPKILTKIMKEYPKQPLSMIMENTQTLLGKLATGEIDFALIEGFFDQNDYQTQPLMKAQFIPICSAISPLAKQHVNFEILQSQPLILREKGSGTREILEQALHQHNLTLNAFPTIFEIGHMRTIKELVAENLGISFLYQCACEVELANNQLVKIPLKNFQVEHEFTIVFLKHRKLSINTNHWISFIKEQVNLTYFTTN